MEVLIKIFMGVLMFLSWGCQSKREAPQLPPIPTHFIVPISPPSFQNANEIQINPVPHPLSLNGAYPYVVWVNGNQVHLNTKQIDVLVQSLNLDISPPPNTAQIHNGEGWLRPLKLNGKQNSNNRINRQKEATTFGL